MKNFKQLLVWQKGFDIAIQSFQLTRHFPAEVKFGLSSQITKSAVSIPSNIAEGSSRASEKEYIRFLEISLGSSYELETQLLISEAINYGPKDLRDLLMLAVIQEEKMLIGFLNKLHVGQRRQ
jgi:four helix bundle protein